MNDLQPLKAVATQMLALSAELLRLITDEGERAALLEAAKKTRSES